MTAGRLQPALAVGFERLAAWSDLLDDINVYPVADADTGRNLVISLAPLHRAGPDLARIVPELLLSATGNSGNIACGFFAGFLGAGPGTDLRGAARAGRDRARGAVAEPMPGTMLTVLDELLARFEPGSGAPADGFHALIEALAAAVRTTAETLPPMKAAGVVDAGALGLFLFLEGFFSRLDDRPYAFRPVTEMFAGRVRPASGTSFGTGPPEGACVDAIVQLRPGGLAVDASRLGDSLVVQQVEDRLKIHVHTADPEAVHRELERAGRVERWTEGRLRAPAREPLPPQAVHVVTDAAGSITRADAAELGITLLPSYLVLNGRSLPETLVEPNELYRAMRSGIRVTTAQASVFERHQSYQRILGRCARALYLCVGSIYTGNHGVVTAWKREHDPEDRLAVFDTGLASGRLGIVARAAARFARAGADAHRLLEFARAASARSEEYLFLDRLQYLAAGGRLSKTRGLIGDLLHVRPVVSPTPTGAQKVGTARTPEDQLAFAAARLDRAFGASGRGSILLEFSDNADWVRGDVLPAIRSRYPVADVVLGPLSLTSGVHMGPGTWGVAVLPDETGPVTGGGHARA